MLLFVTGVVLAVGIVIAAVVITARRRKPESSGRPALAASSPLPRIRPKTPTPQLELDTRQLDESRNVLFRLIADLGASIQQLVRVAATYDAGLAQHEDRLRKSTDLSEAQQICAEVLAEMSSMREVNAQYKQELAETQEKLRERESEIASLQLDMNTDFLTRILNRRGLDARIGEEIERAKRYDTPLSLAMFDIDRFKAINDDFGHAAGDKVLRLVAHTLDELKRTNDSVGRYGGEEFLLLLPAATGEQAVVVADRARRQMERFVTRFNENNIRVTMSGGVVQFDPASDTGESVLNRVDKALYTAKENGRNRIELA